MANLITLIHPMGTAEAKARDLAMGRIEDSITAFGGQNELLRKMNRYYHSLSPSRIRTSRNDIAVSRQSRTKGHEDIFVPMCFALVASAIPHWMFNLYGQKPHMRFLGRKADSHEKADGITKAIDYQMERATVFLQSLPIALSNYKYGTGIGKVGYRYRSHLHLEKSQTQKAVGFNPLTGKAIWANQTVTEKEPIIDFDGPWLDPVSAFLWHPDPLYWRPSDFRYCGESKWTDRQTLEKLDEQYFKLTNRHKYKHLNQIPPMGRQKIGTTLQMDSQDDTAEAMGWNSSPFWRRSRWHNLQDAEEHMDQVVLIREYWEEDRLIEVANDEIVISNGPNPYDDKEIPYILTNCYPVEFSVWGQGYLHQAIGTQEQLNSWRNLNMKQGRYNVHNIWAVPENTDMDVDEWEPGKTYEVPYGTNDKPLVTPLMQGRPIPPEGQWIEAALVQDMQRTHAAPDFMVGAIGGGAETATEAKLQGEGAASRLRLQGSIGELMFKVELGKKFLSRMVQFGGDEQVYRILGANGAVEFLQLTRQDLAGSFDVEPIGGAWYPNMDVLRQQMLEALAVARGDPVMLEISNVYEIWKELWKMFPGIRSPERFVRPPAEKTWDAEKENIILSAGEWVEVTPNEPHEQHYQSHLSSMARAAAENNDKGVAQHAQHAQRHRQYMDQTSQMTPNQEMPGVSGEAGNLPADIQGPARTAVPTSGNIQSKIAGGVGM